MRALKTLAEREDRKVVDMALHLLKKGIHDSGIKIEGMGK